MHWIVLVVSAVIAFLALVGVPQATEAVKPAPVITVTVSPGAFDIEGTGVTKSGAVWVVTDQPRRSHLTQATKQRTFALEGVPATPGSVTIQVIQSSPRGWQRIYMATVAIP